MKKTNVTIKDVARKAGVSIGAVSSVFSKKPSNVRLSPETKKHILDVAKAINYYPNLTAKGFNSGKSYLLGFFFRKESWHIMVRLLQCFQQICYEQEYDLIVYPSDTLEMERRNLERARNRNLDGIITLPFVSDAGNNLELYREFAVRKIPIVQLLCKITDEFPLVGRDYAEIGRDAVRQLYEAGHRHIGLLVHRNFIDPVQGRPSYILAGGYYEEMKRLGLEPIVFPIDKTRMLESREICEREIILPVCEAKQRPTAMIASSNSISYHVIDGLVKKGIRIPEDISIVSTADDVNLSNLEHLSLSYYPIPVLKIGIETVQRCLLIGNQFDESLVFESMIQGETMRKLSE